MTHLTFTGLESAALFEAETAEDLHRVLIAIEFPADGNADGDVCADRHARLAVDRDLEPNDMDTIGSLIDKLVTVNLKMWHNQEDLYEIRRMAPEAFVAKYDHDLKTLHGIVARCCDLNVQRSRLIDAIDRKVSESISAGAAPTMAAHKTY